MTGVRVDLDLDCEEEIDGERWADLLSATLSAEGVVEGAAVGLTFVDVDTMTALNGEHMGAAGPTDVLAFPIDGLDAAADQGGMVGDVVICPAVAWANAPDHAGSPDDETALLVVHGALHLIGHDHAEADERAVMRARERALLADLYGPLRGDPWAAI